MTGFDDGNNGFGRGIIKDFRRTIVTNWKKEMTNFNQKTIAVSFFLFFACITPAITFGGIYQKTTENYIGAVEMILATAWCGITYSLIGGQPIMINGGTGPVLAFSGVLFKMSKSMGVPFLTFNAWVGLWVCAYMLLAAFFDLNRVLQYATRFTDEIFALLISVIFIIAALGNPFSPVGLYYYFVPTHPSHDPFEVEEDYSYMATALLSVILCIGTTSFAFFLRGIKQSPYFYHQLVRSTIADFAVVLSILLFTVLDTTALKNVPTERLNVPSQFAPTFLCCTEECDKFFPKECPEIESAWGYRPWVVNLGDVGAQKWAPVIAAGPAVLAFILVFLDDGITWHLLNHPSHKLTHGTAYNYDTIIMGLMIAVNSMLGLPWLVAATVRSLNHLHALSEKTPSGKIDTVQETRLTNVLIHALVTASIFVLEVLKLIPMPVLYGVFLFMGLVSLGTNQFYGRILMFFMQPSKYPKEPYTEEVAPKQMHKFTLIQLFLFVLLYVIKSIKAIAIVFPIVIAAGVPIRMLLLPKIFTEDELVFLDSDEDAIAKLRSLRASVTEHGCDVEELEGDLEVCCKESAIALCEGEKVVEK